MSNNKQQCFFHKATKTYKLVVTTNCVKRSAVRRWLFAVVLRCEGPMESDLHKWIERLKTKVRNLKVHDFYTMSLVTFEACALLRASDFATMIRTFFKSEEEMRQDLLRFLSFYTEAGR